MKARNTDARVARTKAELKKALLAMLEDGSIDEVSIDELCERAGVHRATFYRHYPSVRALLDEIGEETVNSIGLKLEGMAGAPALEVLTCALTAIQSNATTLHALHESGPGTHFAQTICSYAFDIARGVPPEQAVTSPVYQPTPREAFACGGFVAIAEHWALAGMPRPAADVAREAVSFINQIRRVPL